MADFSPCFLIPCYNHGNTIAQVVNALKPFGFPIMVVDDGSDLQTKIALNDLAASQSITLVTLGKNQGKGEAVITGIKAIAKLNHSHAIQIDADGQHDISAIPELLKQAEKYPDTLISGKPIYDKSVPKARLYGRYATHIWVWIETLSFSIKDSMCGFRAYPITPSLNVINTCHLGKRMDFDTEIMVRLYWNGCETRFIPINVIYPENGISHFDGLRDNLKISAMHTRLFFGMLPRIPKLLKRNLLSKQRFSQRQLKKTPETKSSHQHWSTTKEQGTIFGIKFLLFIYRLLGRKAFRLLLKPIMAYYYVFGAQSRQASKLYLKQLQMFYDANNLAYPARLSSYQHLHAFGETMLDKLAAWQGDFSQANLSVHGEDLAKDIINRKQGIIVFGSHLGNLELCRALSKIYPSLKINALVFTQHAKQFNKVMEAVNPDSSLSLIQVNELSPSTAILLQQKLDQGEWVVIVGDRTSTTQENRVVWSDFLGKKAPFPQGPFILGSVLKAPSYLLFGLRNSDSKTDLFDIYFEPFSEQIKLPRTTRHEALAQTISEYANRLEHYTLKYPLQWHNYFNFWELTEIHHDS